MWCPIGPGAWSVLVCVEGDQGHRGGTAKGTGPQQGGCGKALHKGKVLGATGTCTQGHLQEWSRELEDAVL